MEYQGLQSIGDKWDVAGKQGMDCDTDKNVGVFIRLLGRDISDPTNPFVIETGRICQGCVKLVNCQADVETLVAGRTGKIWKRGDNLNGMVVGGFLLNTEGEDRKKVFTAQPVPMSDGSELGATVRERLADNNARRRARLVMPAQPSVAAQQRAVRKVAAHVNGHISNKRAK
jgi:hypothetical protein